MLNFQTADYCLLVWDGDNIEPDKAIEDLRNTLKEKEYGFKAISIFVPDYECTDIDEMDLLDDMLQSIISAKACLEYEEYTPLDKLKNVIHSCLAILLCNMTNILEYLRFCYGTCVLEQVREEDSKRCFERVL